MTLLRFERVTLVRGGRQLFDGLSFTMEAGDALHVCGRNGAGKSSLLRLAAGLLQAASGRVEAAAIALSDAGLALDRELPLAAALSFWSRLGGPSNHPDDALRQFGIAHLADVPVRLLSTGQAKRASLARVASSSAPLWLLDEPLNGLDRDGADRLATAISRHRAAGGAIVAASHVPLPGDWRQLDLTQ